MTLLPPPTRGKIQHAGAQGSYGPGMALDVDRSAEHSECFIDRAHRCSATDAWHEGVCMSISELQTDTG